MKRFISGGLTGRRREGLRYERKYIRTYSLTVCKRAEYIETELRQSAQEGKDVDASIEQEAEDILKEKGTVSGEEKALRLYERLRQMPVKADFPYREPETLEEILELLPTCSPRAIKKDVLRDKILGAWLGRPPGACWDSRWNAGQETGFWDF